MNSVAMPIKLCRRLQTGVALITVLLIVFLTSIAAVSLASVQQLATRRSALLLQQQQARLYTLGAEQWAVAILKQDQQSSTIDSLDEDWANLPPSLPVQGGTLNGRIEDLQGRFNLNNLFRPAFQLPDTPSDENGNDEEGSEESAQETEESGNESAARDKPETGLKLDQNENNPQGALDPEQLKIFQRLLEVLELNPDIAQAIVDWIDPDQETRFPDGAEDGDYVSQDPSYLAANRPLASVSELRLIKGIDKEVYDKLSPHVCALPSGTPINVNTIVAPLLAALSDKADLEQAEALVEDLRQQSFENLAEFLGAAQLTPDPLFETQLSVNSDYFLLAAEAKLGDGRATLYSTLHRSNNGRVRVLMRNFGNDN